MGYKFLEDIAIADVAFEAGGKDLKELFESAALATFEVMVDTKKVKHKIKRKIVLDNEDLNGLLYDFLSELVYLKDTYGLVFSKFNVNIKENKIYKLKAEVVGDKIDYKKQELRSDVKAVTLYRFKVEKVRNKYKAMIVLDI